MPGGRAVDLGEGLEEPASGLGGQAEAGVVDSSRRRVCRGYCRGQPDEDLAFPVNSTGVAHEAQDLAEPPGIAEDLLRDVVSIQHAISSFCCAASARSSRASSTTPRGSNATFSSSILPASILEKSRTSLMIPSRASPDFAHGVGVACALLGVERGVEEEAGQRR